MGGRYGKYGEIKRLDRLRKSKYNKIELLKNRHKEKDKNGHKKMGKLYTSK